MLLLRHKTETAIFALFSLMYLANTLLVTPDPETLAKYQLSAGEAKWLGLSVALPYIIIWFIALLGYLRLKAYTAAITKSKDGQAFVTITKGVLCLALWLPVSAIASSLTSHIWHEDPAFTEEVVWFNNYLHVVLLLPAFILIDRGAKQLASMTKAVSNRLPQNLMLAYIAFSAVYVLVVLSDAARQAPVGDAVTASYYQPDWLIVTTLVIPRLVMWFLGIQAVYNIYVYRRKIRGAIYKLALNNLARGLAAVVTFSIILRCIQSFSAQLIELSLGLLLLVIYALLVMLSIGYILIAKGARSLQRIEES